MVIRGLLAQSDLLTLLSADQVALEVDAGMLVRIPIALPGTVRTIGIANAIFYHERFTVEPAFLAASRDYFDAEVRALDFADDFVLDGEVFEGGELSVRQGPELEFVVP